MLVVAAVKVPGQNVLETTTEPTKSMLEMSVLWTAQPASFSDTVSIFLNGVAQHTRHSRVRQGLAFEGGKPWMQNHV
eukprot:scaffold51383_cov28-Attheya_sp.AAC.1